MARIPFRHFDICAGREFELPELSPLRAGRSVFTGFTTPAGLE